MSLAGVAEDTADRRRAGRDELNLTEFPFALLASRAPKGTPLSLEFRDGDKHWLVTGDPRYGLPTSGDVEVYVILMELTREQSFPLQVQFSRLNVIQRLGWDAGGQSYDRLQLSLDRLVGVTIRTTNAFWDAQQRAFVRRQAFHVLEAYEVTDSRQARPDEPSLFPSWFRWSPELYANIQSGYIKSLDVELFLSLKSAIARALYRYLDAKRYDGKPQYRIGLKKLAWEHLGLSRGYFPSDIKRKLKAAHEELIDTGFLAGVEYALMKNGEEMVVYRFAPKPKREKPAAELPAGPGPLAERMMERGVSRASAVELARDNTDECERQLEWLSYRQPRDPGAVLVKAIREGWSAPPAWVEAQERARKGEEAARKQAEAVSAAEQKAAAETAFDAWWTEQPEDYRAELEMQATAKVRRENRMLAEFASKHPGAPVYVAAVRAAVKGLCGWQG